MKLIQYLLSTCLVLSVSACTTTGYVSRVDSDRKKVTVQSQSDMGSAIYAVQKQGVLNEVKGDLEEKLKENPRDIPSLVNLAQIYLSQGDYEKAERYCRQGLKFDLKNIEAKLTLAQIYFRRGYTDMAEIIVNSLGKQVQKNSIALNLKALIAMRNDRPAYALSFFRESLKYNPSDVATRMNLGVLYVYYRQVEDAAVQFERVLSVMPGNVDAQLHLAVVKASQGQYSKAEDLYKDVLDIDQGNALAVYNLAVLEEKRDNLDDSLSYIRTYLNTAYARQQNNKEVFAMIERLKTKKDMKGESLSDSEIQDMASSLKKASNTDDRPRVSKTDAGEQKKTRKLHRTKQAEDIETLERELLK